MHKQDWLLLLRQRIKKLWAAHGVIEDGDRYRDIEKTWGEIWAMLDEIDPIPLPKQDPIWTLPVRLDDVQIANKRVHVGDRLYAMRPVGHAQFNLDHAPGTGSWGNHQDQLALSWHTTDPGIIMALMYLYHNGVFQMDPPTEDGRKLIRHMPKFLLNLTYQEEEEEETK